MPGPWGAALRNLRFTLGKGVPRKVIAKRAGVNATSYGRAEKGHHTQTQILQRIADAYGVPIEMVLLPQSQSVPMADVALGLAMVQRYDQVLRASITPNQPPESASVPELLGRVVTQTNRRDAEAAQAEAKLKTKTKNQNRHHGKK